MGFGKSRSYKDLPTSAAILAVVSEIDIFSYYLGGTIPNKPISSPLREDTSPSFSLFHSSEHGIVLYKDFATGEVGNCFVFVMRLFNLSSKIEAINKVAADFSLNQFEIPNSITSQPINLTYTKNRKKTLNTGRLKISVTVRNWSIKDKDYWEGKYGLTKQQLEFCNIHPISHYFVNGYCTKTQDNAYAFVEEKDNIQTFKIYQPYADKENKWINNNDFSTWELWTQLPDNGEVLIVASSRKDALVIKSLFPTNQITACSLQSEGVNPKRNVIDEIRGRFKEVYIMYDNDFDSNKNRGRIAGAKLASQTGFTQIEIPDEAQVKDPSDYIEKFGKQKLKQLIQTLIIK